MKRTKRPFLATILPLAALTLVLPLSALLAHYWAFRTLQTSLNRNKPLWESSFSQLAGYTIGIQHARLKSLLRPELVLQNLNITIPQDPIALLSASQASVSISALPLLSGQLDISEISFQKPQLNFIKHAGGAWNWQRRHSFPESSIKILPLGGLPLRYDGDLTGAALSFQDPNVLFRDESQDKPFALALRLPALIWKCSRPDNLCRLSTAKIAKKNGSSPEAALELLVEYSVDDDSATINLSEQNLKLEAEGRLRHVLDKTPQFTFTLKSRGADVADLTALINQPTALDLIRGRIKFDMDLEGEGFHPADIQPALAAEGAFEITNGAIRRINLIHDLLSELAPNRSSTSTDQPLPSWLHRLLSLPETPIDLGRGKIKILPDSLEFEGLEFQSAYYLIQGDGTYSVRDTTVDIAGNFVLLEQLSGYLLRVYPELKPLQNATGRLIIPFRILGLAPNPSMMVLAKLPYERTEELSKIAKPNTASP